MGRSKADNISYVSELSLGRCLATDSVFVSSGYKEQNHVFGGIQFAMMLRNIKNAF